MNSILILNGMNFKDWKENIYIVLGHMDLDLALRIDTSTTPLEKISIGDKDNYEKWERSNRMCLMIIKRGIPEAFRGVVSEDITNAKEFLTEIEKRFVRNDKEKIGAILACLVTLKYKGNGNIREHILEMSHIVSRLKTLKLDLSEDLLVHLILLSLPTQYY
ncbi:uncharacterized protein LOC124946230 [Impatiens glandulifera]|uniref:uncharacterized protein LOC124946230 n=1 Tax=Impatiens glandulifera TaxID=253017 RepID=UPI001FB0930F|nr:uncharacterized protein LOC124946230 [Impatiens glandulifera]